MIIWRRLVPPALRRRCWRLRVADARPAGGARASDHHATPRSTVKASTTCWSCLRPTLPDWRRACADHHHQRAASCDDGPHRAGQRVGCAHGNYQVAQHVHQPCSACLRVCACRGGTLLPVLYVCVSSYGPESWYLGRSTSVTNSVLTTGIPERVLIIREPGGPMDPCRRKRVNYSRH